MDSADGRALPLNTYLKAEKFNLDRYPAAFLSAGQFKGETYGLPNRCHIQLLFYRKDVFNEVGLAAPKTCRWSIFSKWRCPTSLPCRPKCRTP